MFAVLGWCGRSAGAAAGAPSRQRLAYTRTTEKNHATHINWHQEPLSVWVCHDLSFLPSSGSSESGSIWQLSRSHHSSLCRSATDKPPPASFLESFTSIINACTSLWNLVLDPSRVLSRCAHHALVDDHTHHHVWMSTIYLKSVMRLETRDMVNITKIGYNKHTTISL